MPDLNEDEPVLPSTDAPAPRRVGPPEVEALHRIDELIGNREHLGPKSLGKVRGIVLDTLNAWHTKVRERQQIVAGGRPSPLPSELLESCDGGQGIAAFVLTPDVLDRLPVLMRDQVPDDGMHPADERVFDDVDEALAALTVDPRQFVSVEDANRVLAEERASFARARAEWDERSRQGREQADRLVEQAAELRRQLAATRADQALVITERDDARRQLVEQGEAAEEQADALRSEVARLSGLLDESIGLRPVDGDPRRPRLDHFPDDAILLTYRELRQLVGLHLEACASAVAPADSARAMRDGETGLRLAEVLDR